jgi:hypothetical protein
MAARAGAASAGATKQRRRIGTILAERLLGEQGSGRVVRVSLGAPRPRTNGDWECPFRIHGAGISRVEFGYGIDSMQALTTALDGIRVLLDESGLALGWKMGAGRQDIWHDETGFARSIPIALGPAITRRLERVVDREILGEVQRLERRSKRTSRPALRKARKASKPRKARKAR